MQLQRFSSAINPSTRHIFNLIGSSSHTQQAIYDITLHLYSHDIKYKISKKMIPGLTVRFSENNYKELVDAYMQKDTENKDSWNVLINNCNYISCEEIKDLNKYIREMSHRQITNHNLFVFPNKSKEIRDSCVHITCKCKNIDELNMREYYLSEKHDSTKQFVQSLLNNKYMPNDNSKILLLPQRERVLNLEYQSSSSSVLPKSNPIMPSILFSPDI